MQTILLRAKKNGGFEVSRVNFSKLKVEKKKGTDRWCFPESDQGNLRKFPIATKTFDTKRLKLNSKVVRRPTITRSRLPAPPGFS